MVIYIYTVCLRSCSSSLPQSKDIQGIYHFKPWWSLINESSCLVRTWQAGHSPGSTEKTTWYDVSVAGSTWDPCPSPASTNETIGQRWSKFLYHFDGLKFFEVTKGVKWKTSKWPAPQIAAPSDFEATLVQRSCSESPSECLGASQGGAAPAGGMSCWWSVPRCNVTFCDLLWQSAVALTCFKHL